MKKKEINELIYDLAYDMSDIVTTKENFDRVRAFRNAVKVVSVLKDLSVNEQYFQSILNAIENASAGYQKEGNSRKQLYCSKCFESLKKLLSQDHQILKKSVSEVLPELQKDLVRLVETAKNSDLNKLSRTKKQSKALVKQDQSLQKKSVFL